MSDQHKNPSFETEQNVNNETENLATETIEERLEPAAEVAINAELEAELVAARDEAQQFKEAALRAQAEAQNVRRRAELDVEKAHKFALEKFAKEVITVADNLERALLSTEKVDAPDAMREGVELTLKSLIETLARFDVKAIDPQGEPFNPELQQAITMVPNKDMEPNTVMDVIQKGYTLHGRLLRPAMVVVSSAG